MLKCKLTIFSSYYKHYKDQEFELINIDGKMVNITYTKYDHKSSICVPYTDVVMVVSI